MKTKISTRMATSFHKTALAVLFCIGGLAFGPAAEALPPPLQTYFIPLPETHTYDMFETINSATTTNIVNVISIAANATNTIIVWDHFEDGYEADIANPTQATTRIWGDGNTTNGIPPGFATDVINAGTVIALRSTVGVPHNPTNIVFDGQDKFTATKAVATSFAAWPADPGAVLADAIEVTDTTSWGTNYISPVGTNVAASSSFFEYSSLSIMAAEAGTVVRVDLNSNGVFEATNTLGAGQAWQISTGVVAGSQITASKPVQVALLTGDVNSQYEARWFNLTPVKDWCYCGIVPVSTTQGDAPVNVFLYNQYTHSITVDVSLVGSSNNFVVPAKGVYRYAVPSGSAPQMLIRGQNPNAPTLFYLAVGIMDASDPNSNNSDHDWGFTVPTLRSLSPQVLVGWGPGADTNSGSWTGTENGSPVWVVARSNTTLYVDYDGNPGTGPLTDPNGNKYNFSTNVLAFQSLRIFDPDRDQTGMRVYSLNGTPISAAWGQDPSAATPFNPYLDMGTTIPALASFDGSKSYALVAGDGDSRVEPGETLEYTLTLVNGSFNAIESISLLDPLPPNVAYVPNSTKVNGVAVADDGSGTPFPLDAPGFTNIPDVVSFSNVVVAFRVTLNTPFPQNESAITNEGTFFTADGDLTVRVETPVVQADLELTKSVNNASPFVGSNVVYTITVTNRGPDTAEEVVVRDVLPAGVTYVSHGGGAYVPGSGLWTIGTLAVGGATSLTITATAVATGAITNVAQVNAAGVFDPDSTPGNENGLPYEDDEDDAVINPQPQIDLQLTKGVNNATPNVGQNILYTIAVTNRGPSPASGVTVADVLPAGLAYVSHSGGAYAPGTGVWTIGVLAVGGSTNLQITATVTNSGNINNIAQVQTANEFDPDSTPGNSVPSEDDQDDAALTVPPAIDLELAKSVDNATPSVGANIVYTLVLTNKGPNNATGVTVADVLPAGLAYVSHTGPGTYVATSGVWTIGGPMVPGASRILAITATVTASGTRTNFAQVRTADQFDVDSQPGNAPPYTQDDDDFVAITVAPAADLELAKSVNNSTPNVGQSVVFTVSVTNRGPDNATGVTVEDILPAGLAYVSHSGGAYVPGTGIWTIGALNVGSVTTLQITASVTNSGNIDNIAQVQTADQFDVDSTPGNDVPSEDDQDDAALTVPPAIDLELTKSVDNATPSVGANIVYTLVLTNKGPNNATGVTVADVLPAGLAYVSHTGPGTYVATSGVWTIGGPMVPGASRILAITATVTASGTRTNFAQVRTADQFDVDSQPGNAPPYTQDDDDFVAITVAPAADLELAKSVNNSTPNVGQSVVFTVSVTNRGPDNATGVTVEDILPAGLAYVSHSGGAYVPGTGIWTIGALNVGSVTTLQITASVTNSGAIENIAQVQTADQFDVDSTPGNDVPSEDDQDDADLTVPAAGDLELTKSVDNATPNVSSNVTFTVVVTNRGPNAQQSVTVLDALPAGLTYVGHANGLYNPGTGIWSIGNLNANASTSLTITAAVMASGPITNFAQVQTALHYDVDSTPGNAPPYAEDDDDFAVVDAPPAADLELRKDVDNGNPNLFDDVTFTVTVTNRGPDGATGVTVEDVLPTGLAYVGHGGGAYVPGTGIWTIGDLAVGGTTSLTITATVNDTGVITNTAQVETANEFDLDSTPGNSAPGEDDQDNALVSVGEAADLALDKSVDNPAPNVGGSIVYAITVTNSGPDNATGVAVEDVLPAGLGYVSDDGGGAYDSGTGIWTIGSLNVGDTAALQITASVDAAGTFTNIAQVNVSEQYDPDSVPDNDDPAEDDQDDAVINTPQADLELSKAVDNSTPNVTEDVVFTIVVTNRGPDNATGVTAEDILPAGLAYVSHSGGTYDNGTGVWNIGNLAAGGSTSLLVTATVTNSGIIDNIAQVETADQYDPDSTPGNDNPQEDDQDNATLNVPPASDLELTKDVDNATPAAGQNVAFTITLTNEGPDEGEGITVEDVLPAGLAYVSHANGAYVPGTGIWSIGDLAVGASTSLTLTVQVTVDGVFTNVAQVQTSDHFDPDSTPGNEDGPPYEDDEDDAVVAASPVIDLEVDKIVDKAQADPFEHVVWTVTVTNKGPSAATGLTVYDPLPANWVYVGDSSGAYDTNTSIWTIGTLPAGGSTSLAITAYATLGVTVMGHGPVPPGYTNVAQVWTQNEDDIDSTPGNGDPGEDDQDDAFIPIRALSDLALTKTVDNPTPYLGSQIAYTVVVTNEGPQPAVGVLIEDVLPAGLTYVSNSVGAAYSPGTGIWDIGLMLPTWSRTLTIWATVDVTGLITNVAQVNHNEHFDIDSTPDNDDPGEDDQDEVTIDGQPLVDVELDKLVDKAQADPFENVVWTVTVTNKGPSAATGLTVYDPLPANWVYVGDSSGAYDTNTSIWTIGTLPAGGSTSLAITAYATLGVTVMGHGPVPPGYTNVAQVWAQNEDDIDSTPGNGDPDEDDQDDAEIPIRALSDLALTKSVDNPTPYLGSQIAYTVVVTNEGPQPAVGVLIEDVLPAGLTYVSNSVGAAYSPGTGIWDIGLMLPTWSRTMTIWATVDATGPITNVAQVNHNEHFDIDSTPDNDDPAEDDQDEVVIDGRPLADVELDKTVDKAQADPFEHVVWTVTVTNKGPSAATGLTVYDPLPANWVYVGDSSGAYDTNTSIWTIGTLPAGGSTSLAITAYATLGVTVMGHGPVPPGYTNVAQVWTQNEDDIDSTPGNGDPGEDDQDDAFIPIRALSDLALTKTVDDDTPFVGQTILYTVVVTNEGPQPAVGVLVEDVLPAGLLYVSNSLGAAFNPVTGIWDAGNVFPGQSKTLVIAAQVNMAGAITNVAQVNHNEHFDIDSTPDNDNPQEDDQDEVVVDAYHLAAVGDYIWLDEDWDGVQDAGEPGLANVGVELLDGGANVIASTLTDLNGVYLFVGLEPGTYTVRVDTGTLAPQLAANPTYDPDPTQDHQTTVTLVSGEVNRTADFAYNWNPDDEPLGSIGDRVWVDADADGMQEPGEPGIPNVTVRLYTDGAGNGSYSTLAASTTTDAGGLYLFPGLSAGSYVVRIATNTLPANYTQTGDPDSFGVPLPAGTGDHQTTTPAVLAPGDVFVNADFGYWYPTGSSLGDLIYFDANADGVFNAADGDYGIEDVTVVLLDGGGHVIASAITGHPDGLYLFTGLPAGTYTVWVNDTYNVLAGLVQTGDPDGGLDRRSTTVLDGVNDDLNQDHGFADGTQEPGLGLIGDSVFMDRDGDGLPGVGEGIQGATVNLYDGAGTTLLATTVSDLNGHYYFGGLEAGSYVVRVDASTLPNGGAGLVNTVDPDTTNPGDGESAVALGDGEINLAQDFGYVGPNTIGGTLWRDCDADGVLDPEETPRWAGVTVFLRDGNGNVAGSMLTDTNGDYSFPGLPDGTYTVDVVDHDNALNGFWHSLGPNIGADNNSQPDPYTVAVSGGETDTTGDFGYYLVVAELGDYVWYDINANGIQDGGEPGLANVKVTLRITYPNGNVITMQTLTDSTGHYVFSNLLLDERYNESTMGDPSVEGLPRFQISIDGAQAILTADGYVPTLINAGNGANDSRNSGGIFALLKRCGRPATYDFGYSGGPLLAVIGSVEAFTRDGQTIVRWETVESWDTAGFWLERQIGGEWVRISQEMLPFPLFGVAPIVYEEVDPGAVPGGTYLYRLVELENDGDELFYGPYSLTVDGPGHTYADWAAEHFAPAELADPAIGGRDADPDGDGLTNEQEFLAGTDPNNADSVLQITGLRKVEAGLELSWSSVAGRSYRIALSDSMHGPFLPLEQPILAADENGSVVLPLDFSDRQMYFQVILVGGD